MGKVIASWVGILAVLISAAAILVSAVQGLQAVDQQLDRNCRLIVQLDRDIRLFLLAHEQEGSAQGGVGSRGVPPDVRNLLAPFDDLSC